MHHLVIKLSCCSALSIGVVIELLVLVNCYRAFSLSKGKL